MPAVKLDSKCNHCSAKATEKPLQKCGGCRAIKYCSRECQKADWKSHKRACQNNAELAQALKEHEMTPAGLLDRFLLPDGISMYQLDQRLEKWVKFHHPILMWASIHALGLPTSLANARTMVLYLKLAATDRSIHGGSVGKYFALEEAYVVPIEEAKRWKAPWPAALEGLRDLQEHGERAGTGTVCAAMVECEPLAVQTVPFGSLKNLGIPGTIMTWKDTLTEHITQGKRMSLSR